MSKKSDLTFQSKFIEVGDILLPRFSGTRVMMMPITLGDLNSVPDELAHYLPTLKQMFDAHPKHHGQVGYLTIDEKTVKKGKTHRRAGKHVDGVYSGLVINYQRLGRAASFYTAIGFVPKEVPWTASGEIMNITAPPDGVVTSSVGLLVGSAEQSILECVAKKRLLPGKIFAITPRFRGEPEDDLHHKYFMKLELFQNKSVSMENLKVMIRQAQTFFAGEGLWANVVETGPQAFDLVCKISGVELGSYGIRTHALTGPWIYGTGLAEPRFSTVGEMVGLDKRD